MNGEEYKVLDEAVGDEFTIEPEPVAGEDVQCFDVISAEGEIPVARLANTIIAAARQCGSSFKPELVTAQSHRVTFEDLRVK